MEDSPGIFRGSPEKMGRTPGGGGRKLWVARLDHVTGDVFR